MGVGWSDSLVKVDEVVTLFQSSETTRKLNYSVSREQERVKLEEGLGSRHWILVSTSGMVDVQLLMLVAS